MKEINNLFDKEPSAMADGHGTLAEAMARRDAQVDEAVTALRSAAGAAATSVGALMQVVSPDASRHRLARLAAAKISDGAGFATVAQQLQDIALRLRVLESSVRGVLERTRRDAAPDD